MSAWTTDASLFRRSAAGKLLELHALQSPAHTPAIVRIAMLLEERGEISPIVDRYRWNSQIVHRFY